MNKYNGSYIGNLRCKVEHLASACRIETDAPKDNQGKGELFSPTDLLAASLGTCMLTIIAIRAKTKKIDLGNVDFKIEKVMHSSPRKVASIRLKIKMSSILTVEQRSYLESEGLNCPVALSLHPDIKQEVNFEYT
ncbi:MAG: OsmC family protein [Vicingaceae bacterium]